ncbi:hypothetical protein BKA59DRAFT_552767 [Fusarium tricinctum]|uniref:Uncharacterized protein n=1 Tax=Fusarium tricinctum TaxID=61284 RepID=A0A8K0S9F2_9HYPO|nr:hypothetical protein BKA59DRAFT_552767 [Fusarium tricinctum]
MIRNRRRSVPAGTGAPLSPPPSQNSNYWSPALVTSNALPPISRSPTTSFQYYPKSNGAKVLKQAEALATMSFELNLRAVWALANRLEQDVRMLVSRTANDQEFRRQNEERMTKMMQEVQVVKVHMAQFNGSQPATQADIEELQQEMNNTTLGWNKQLEDARAKVDDISSRIQPDVDTIVVNTNDPEPNTPPTSGVETRAMRRARAQLGSSNQEQQNSPKSLDLESRINEAINSTKRWNREHKVTKMRDNQFITSYFKKQGQRDPELAKILQQTLQKRAPRAYKTRSRKTQTPQSLEELCRNIAWQDVIDTATEVLVVNRSQTLRALGQV